MEQSGEIKKCSVEVCDREETPGNRGYCSGHYKRWVEGRPLNTPLRKLVKGGARCTIPDCDKKVSTGGLCPTHARRKAAGKDLYAPVRDYIITDDLEVRLRHYAPAGGPDECWEWTAGLNKGYGMISIAGSKLRGAHIVAWEIANGRELPKGMLIRHSCDNPPCTNPAHLLLGTNLDNANDRVEHGNQRRGEDHQVAKLTNAEVLEICRLYDEGMSQRVVGKLFGIKQNHVSLIVRGDIWGELTGRVYRGRSRHEKMDLARAEEMRGLRAEHGYKYAELASMFGVSQATVSNVISGKTWPSATLHN